jgi:hypothetical protein
MGEANRRRLARFARSTTSYHYERGEREGWRCIACAMPMTGMTGEKGFTPDDPGVTPIFVCLLCSCIMELVDGKLAPASDEALVEIAGQEGFVDGMEFAGEFQKWSKREGRQ